MDSSLQGFVDQHTLTLILSTYLGSVYTFTIQKNPPTHNRMVIQPAYSHTHLCSPRQGNLPPSRSEPLGPTPPPPASHNAALSRRRTENKPPHFYNATPAENNPPPLPQIELISSLYSCILYYYLLCFIVFYLTPVLIRFDKLCVCRDLYTTRARMHIAST